MARTTVALLLAVGLGCSTLATAANHGAAQGAQVLKNAQVPKNWTGLHQVDLAMRIPARFALPARTAQDGPAFDASRLPALGSEGVARRAPSRAEEFARRVHHEGLPLLRLWQTKSALLSVGLNPHGKPGLWLTQKLP